jgi:hypothetical protein
VKQGALVDDPSPLDWLREQRRLLTARDLADVLGYENVKRVYELQIPRVSLGAGGQRALRWDPRTVAKWVAGRVQPGPQTERAAACFLTATTALSRASVAATLRVRAVDVALLAIPPSALLSAEVGHPTWDARDIEAWLAAREMESASAIANQATFTLHIALSTVAIDRSTIARAQHAR